ncbi:MAG: hypothetical protein JXA07_06590 [Spirochaetes bacterium]|nr:hypothetical protein [Spirochaetota bacterium]
MKIETKKLIYLINKYIDEFSCVYYADVGVEGKKFKAGSEVLLLDANHLAKAGVKEIEIRYNVTLYEYLTREFPGDYRRPVRWVDYPTMTRILEELDLANSQSRRKRFLYIVGDVYRTDRKNAMKEIVFRHDEKLDSQKWKANRIYIDIQEKFFLRDSECGIIIYGNIKSEEFVDDNGYRRKMDLLGMMLARRYDKKFEISPDFIPNTDVFRVSEPDRLLQEYISTNAKLIVLGDTVTTRDKEALLQVKRHDPYVRMMVCPPLNPDNIDHLLLQIKMMYNTDRWDKL